MSNRTRERLRALENYLDDPTVASAEDPELSIVAVPLHDLAWLVRALSDVSQVREEFHRTCDPAPFTSERALIERIDAALDKETQ